MVVSMSIALSGYSAATFTSTLQTGFKRSVAATLGRSVSDITITKVTDTAPPAGRHLLQPGVSVTVGFTIAVADTADAATVNVLTKTEALSRLASNLSSQGIPISANDLSITMQPTILDVATTTGINPIASGAASISSIMLTSLLLWTLV
jgi:hypothetical protein